MLVPLLHRCPAENHSTPANQDVNKRMTAFVTSKWVYLSSLLLVSQIGNVGLHEYLTIHFSLSLKRSYINVRRRNTVFL